MIISLKQIATVSVQQKEEVIQKKSDNSGLDV